MGGRCEGTQETHQGALGCKLGCDFELGGRVVSAGAAAKIVHGHLDQPHCCHHSAAPAAARWVFWQLDQVGSFPMRIQKGQKMRQVDLTI